MNVQIKNGNNVSLRGSVALQIKINQSNFYSANIPSDARLSNMTAASVFNRKIDETVPWHQQAVRCLLGKGPVKEMCLRLFLEGSN